jgi:hypothetical protein
MRRYASEAAGIQNTGILMHINELKKIMKVITIAQSQSFRILL